MGRKCVLENHKVDDRKKQKNGQVMINGYKKNS